MEQFKSSNRLEVLSLLGPGLCLSLPPLLPPRQVTFVFLSPKLEELFLCLCNLFPEPLQPSWFYYLCKFLKADQSPVKHNINFKLVIPKYRNWTHQIKTMQGT